MAASNKKTERNHILDPEVKLAGGMGNFAARQSEEQELRRLVLACLLWEDIAYTDGVSVAANIKRLIPLVAPEKVAALAVEARLEQKLRHVPLFICREMVRHATHKPFVAETLSKVVRRADELTEFAALYRKDNTGGKKMLPRQVKKGLAAALRKFDEYQLAKYDRAGKEFSLKDVLFLTHAKPKDEAQAALWKRLVAGEMKTPDTWEVGLSAAKSPAEKKAVWERLLSTNMLGASAFLKNLRNMEQVGVDQNVIASACSSINPGMLLPVDFLKAATHAPKFVREIETLMFRCAAEWPKLPGWTVFVVDVSGSMCNKLSGKSDFTRLDAATSMCVLAAEMCERITIYATAGSDARREHATQLVPAYRGFGLSTAVLDARNRLGGGGIFTRQCLKYIAADLKGAKPDRIVVFSDSQDCDLSKELPKPFGSKNYIVDISSESHGVNYKGVWTASMSGWSESFLKYIAAYEMENQQ